MHMNVASVTNSETSHSSFSRTLCMKMCTCATVAHGRGVCESAICAKSTSTSSCGHEPRPVGHNGASPARPGCACGSPGYGGTSPGRVQENAVSLPLNLYVKSGAVFLSPLPVSIVSMGRSGRLWHLILLFCSS